MSIDTVLLWIGLFSSVIVLARGTGGMWAAKSAFVFLIGGLAVAKQPLLAGWLIGGSWVVLIAIPLTLSILARGTSFAQRYRLTLLLQGALVVFHPDRASRDGFALFQALTASRAGDVDRAIARFGRLIADPRARPDTVLTALFHKARLERTLDVFVQAVDWTTPASPIRAMIQLGALAALGRGAALISAYAAHGATLRDQGSRASGCWAFGLMSLLAGAGRPAALDRLFAGPLHRVAPATKALHGAMAQIANDGDAEAARKVLLRLRDGADRDIGSRAAQVLATPPEPMASNAEMTAILAAAEADLDATLAARAARPRLVRSPVTLGLVGLNLVMFAAEIGLGGDGRADVLRRLGALWPSMVWEDGQWWRVAAATVLHYGWLHLGLNMLALMSIGPVVERAQGWWQVLAIYLGAGLGSMAGIVVLFERGWMPDEWVVGASGAIMGLFGAVLVGAGREWRGTRSRGAGLRFLGLAALVVVQGAIDAATPQISFTGHALGVVLGIAVALPLGRRPIAADAPGTSRAALQADAATPVPRMPRRQAIVIVAAGAVAIRTALLFPERRDRAQALAATREAETISPAQLAAIRHLHFIFVEGLEAGGPAVDPARPFGSPNPFADLAAATGVANGRTLRALYQQAMQRLPLFCARARLAPGSYLVDGTVVDISADQVTLVAALSWETPGTIVAEPENGAWPGAYVDFKRPYGDLSYFEADMAEALGIPVTHDTKGQAQLSSELENRLDALHATMAAVLRVFVVHAQWP